MYALVCENEFSHMGENSRNPNLVCKKLNYKKRINNETIRIHHEYEGGIEKSVPRITDWHHEACRVLTISDREGRIFLSHPYTHDGYFFLLTTKYLIIYYKDMKKLPENREFAEMRHDDVIVMLK